MPNVIENCNHIDPKWLPYLEADDPSPRVKEAVCSSGKEKSRFLFIPISVKAKPELVKVDYTNKRLHCDKKTCIYNSQNPDNQTHTLIPEYTPVGKLSAEQLEALGENPPQGSVTALFKSDGGTLHLGIEIKGKPNEFLVDEAYSLAPQAIEKLKAASQNRCVKNSALE